MVHGCIVPPSTTFVRGIFVKGNYPMSVYHSICKARKSDIYILFLLLWSFFSFHAYGYSITGARQFGDCGVGVVPSAKNMIMLTCGLDPSLPGFVLNKMPDPRNKENIIPVLIINIPNAKYKDKSIKIHFDGGVNQIEAIINTPPNAWFVYQPDTSAWPSIFQSIMSSQSITLETESNTYTIDVTGFSQAFQYFCDEYKKMHNEPFPGSN